MTRGPGIARTRLPQGFFAAGVNCGIRRYRPDLGLIFSEVPAVGAGMFTLNQCAAAPVMYSRALLPSNQIRAIVTNSGQANAATGPEGDAANLQMAMKVAEELGCAQSEVLTASTGAIGPKLDLEKILPAVGELVKRADETAENFALAILTTDLVPKTATTEVQLSGGVVRLTGICKGSGMIHPNMATMLGYLLTDAKLTPEQADGFLRRATDISFNMISVDGDTSTNDAVFLLANGMSQVAVQTEADELAFTQALDDLAILLAQSIAADGEGASKLVEVQITGASSLTIARKAARGVTISPLVKTALHGEDPNWGRVLARLGAEQVPMSQLAQMDLRIQDCLIFAGGRPQVFDRDYVKSLLRQHKIVIAIDLHSGAHEATAWGCDLSKKYVDINVEYS